jgi:uncharacterized membrane protein YebE (DUF533 family)
LNPDLEGDIADYKRALEMGERLYGRYKKYGLLAVVALRRAADQVYNDFRKGKPKRRHRKHPKNKALEDPSQSKTRITNPSPRP